MPVAPVRLEPDEEHRLAATIFHHVWDLLNEPDRSVSQAILDSDLASL
jgi:hypothetical protein